MSGYVECGVRENGKWYVAVIGSGSHVVLNDEMVFNNLSQSDAHDMSFHFRSKYNLVIVWKYDRSGSFPFRVIFEDGRVDDRPIDVIKPQKDSARVHEPYPFEVVFNQ